jgi:site-specific recombinase XerD
MKLTELVDRFEQSLRRRRLSPNTVEAYHWALNDLVNKAMAPARLTEVSDLTRDVLEEWQDAHIEDWVPRTRGLAITGVRQFLKFGLENDYITDNKLTRSLATVKLPDPEPHPVPEESLAAIRAYLLNLPKESSIVELRDRALFPFILATGGRVAEILQVRVDNYEAPRVIQKGGGPKTLNVPLEAGALIRDYLAVRGYPEQPLLWLSHTTRSAGQVMTPSQVRKVWKVLSELLKIPYWTTHEIRHACATELLKAKVPHLVIAEHMGHHGLATIANYAKVLDEAKIEVRSIMGGFMRTEAA